MLRGLEGTISELGLQRVTAQTSNSGSYRTEHVLTYLERALPTTADTAPAGHWRLIYCDRYRAHESDAMRRLAWEHRAVVLLHGGGTTGVAQVNDTHLHGALSKAYQELEMHLGVVQLVLDPNSCPNRSRADCVRDLGLMWGRSDLHLTALAGWKANMIMNALDGSEDRLASSEVRAFWDELEMDTLRKDIIQDICTECEAGRLEWSFEVVYSLVEDFDTTGFLDFYEEGQEDEGEEPEVAPLGERPWRDNEDLSGAEDDPQVPETPVPEAPPLVLLTTLLITLAVVAAAAWRGGRALDAMQLSDDEARSVGVPLVHLLQSKPCIMSHAMPCFSSITAMAWAVSKVGSPFPPLSV